MKTVCKKLFMLLLVAMLLVAVAPAAFAADPVDVKVYVTLDGTEITKGKTLRINEGETKNLTKELAQPMINDWDNREFVNWSPVSSIDYATAKAAIEADSNYHLTINLKSCTWDAGVQTKAPTCTEKGVKTYTCTSCGAKKTEDILKLEHAFDMTKVVEEKAPTCTEKGYKKYACTNTGCTERKTVEVDSLGHDWGTGVQTKAPTCTEKGVMTYTCKRDSSHTRTEDIDATGHNFENAICTVCGSGSAVYDLKFVFLDANGKETTITKEIRNNETIVLPTLSKVPSKAFLRWEDGDKRTITSSSKWHVGESRVITAIYEADTTDDGLANLEVWANYYVEGVYHHREKLFTKSFDKSNRNTMFTWLYSDEGLEKTREAVFGGGANSDYQWASEIFYNYYGDAAVTEASMKSDGNKAVYIKVTSKKSMEASVMLYVHLKQTETVDRIIAMPGYTAGDYVSSAAVKNAVKTKYTGSNMTISDLYTEDSWDRLMDGQKSTGASSVKVEDNGTTKIHVIVKNATSKSSATKDPTNPSTGDNIMIVVGTMTVAAAGLAAVAVLKKRKMI